MEKLERQHYSDVDAAGNWSAESGWRRRADPLLHLRESKMTLRNLMSEREAGLEMADEADEKNKAMLSQRSDNTAAASGLYCTAGIFSQFTAAC